VTRPPLRDGAAARQRDDARPPRGPGLSRAGVLQAIPDAALAAAFALAWARPDIAAPWLVRDLVLVMLYEFIVVHSTGFMGAAWFAATGRRGRVLMVLGLGLLYTLFVGGFAAAFGTWWPLLAFWGLTLNRALPMLLRQARPGEEGALVLRTWVAGVIFYLGFTALTVVADVPPLGLTPDVAAAVDLPGGGLWIDEPHRALAFGSLYFAATALSGAFAHAWVPVRAGDV